MKLSQFARQNAISYKTAWRMWKRGELQAVQLPSGTIVVKEPSEQKYGVALYARVSSADQKGDCERQLMRLREYAAARGYQVSREVAEIASGLNDQRPKLIRLLTDRSIGRIIVEHKDRLTRFGFNYIVQLLAVEGRTVEPMIETDIETDTKDELVDDFIAIITSMAARIYGRRNSRRKAERVKRCVESVMQVLENGVDEDEAQL